MRRTDTPGYFGDTLGIFSHLCRSQPVIADDTIIGWGTSLNFFVFFGPQAQHSITAQHSTAQRSQPAPAAKQVGADQSATTHVSRQSCSSQHVAEHLRSSLRSQHERRNRNLPDLQKYTRYNHSQSSLTVCYVACTLHSLVLSISSIHSASGLFLRTIGLLAVVRRQFAPKTMDLCPLHSFVFCHLFLQM